MRRPPTALAPVALALTLAFGATACNRGTVPSARAFCDRVEARLAELKGPVTDVETAKKSVQAYRDVEAVAPAPVRDAWKTVTDLVEAAASLDLTSTAAQSAFAERAVAADRQVRTIVTYTNDTCGVALNPTG